MVNVNVRHRSLSQLEHVVMDYIWSHARATAAQVREALASRRRMKDSTVRTVLRRLEEKGYVRHQVEGRTYVYSPLEAPQSVAVRALRQIIARFCEGSVEQLLVGMVENAVVSRRELQSLANKVARRSEGKGA
jgi:predicted transcriptional regulator